MSKPLCLTILALFATLSLRAVETKALSAPEKAALVKEANALQQSVKNGEPDLVIAKTHPAVAKLFGSQENFEKMTRQLLTQMAAQGAKMESVEVKDPTETFLVADEQFCFVPTVMVISVSGQRVKSIGFLIAARKRPAGDWKFLDASSLRKNPDLLERLFPGFPKDADLPPMSMEKVN